MRLQVEPWQLLFPGFERGQASSAEMSEEAIRAAHLID